MVAKFLKTWNTKLCIVTVEWRTQQNKTSFLLIFFIHFLKRIWFEWLGFEKNQINFWLIWIWHFFHLIWFEILNFLQNDLIWIWKLLKWFGFVKSGKIYQIQFTGTVTKTRQIWSFLFVNFKLMTTGNGFSHSKNFMFNVLIDYN